MGKKLTFLVIGALGFQATLRAQVETMTSNNSTASVNVGTQAGLFNWSVQGQNAILQQQYWFRTNSSPNASVDTLPLGSVSLSGNNLNYGYNGTGFNVQISDQLTGGATVAVGQVAVSDIGETITINNTSGSTLSFNFFQFSHFNFGSSTTVQLGKNLSGLYNEALFSTSGASLSDIVTSPGANNGEVNTGTATVTELNNGTAYNLNGTSGPLGPGDVTGTLQWSLSIAAGNSAIISEDNNLKITIVPEPSTWTLLGLGLAGLYILRRRQATA